MIRGFIGEFDKIIPKIKGNCSAPECKSYMDWFVQVIKKAFEEKKIDGTAFPEIFTKKILSILSDPQLYADAFINEMKEYEGKLSFLKKQSEKKIVLFGAGHWGIEVLRILDINGDVNVCAFADNSTEKQGSTIANLPVYSIEECLKKFPTATYIITNEKNRIEMKKQFVQCGGDSSHLVVALGEI